MKGECGNCGNEICTDLIGTYVNEIVRITDHLESQNLICDETKAKFMHFCADVFIKNSALLNDKSGKLNKKILAELSLVLVSTETMTKLAERGISLKFES